MLKHNYVSDGRYWLGEGAVAAGNGFTYLHVKRLMIAV